MASFKRTPKINVGEFPYADIMPLSRKRAIENAVTQKKWVKIVAVGVAAAILLSGASFGFKFVNQMTYNSAVSDQKDIETQISKNSATDDALSIFDSRTNSVDKATAAQIKWAELYKKLQEATPEGASLGTAQIVPGGTNSKEAAVAVILDITSNQPISYSDAYDSFSDFPGLVKGQIAISNLSGDSGTSNAGTSEANAPSAGAYSYSIGLLLDGSYLKYESDTTQTNSKKSTVSDEDKRKAFAEANDGTFSAEDLRNLRDDVNGVNANQTSGTDLSEGSN